MKRLKGAETEEYSLEVMECDCGFHMGFDASYLINVGDFYFECPSCHEVYATDLVFPEDE